MKAEKNQYSAAVVERMKNDEHWSELMDLARKYGFITAAYGGVAVVQTHQQQLQESGEEQYIRRQKQLFGVHLEVQHD